MKKILIVAILLAFAVQSADAAGFWAGRQAPKLPAIYHSVEGSCVGFYDLDGQPIKFKLTMKLLRQIGELTPGHGYKLRVPDGKLAGWRHKSKGYPLKRPSPCATWPEVGHRMTDDVIAEDFSETAMSCSACYRAQGAVCYLAGRAELDIRLTREDDPDHEDHGITRIAQACRDLENP